MAEATLESRIITLLEAERAGVLAARALSETARDSTEKDLMAVILDGERESCRILGRTLLGLGSRGSGRVGDFARKVMALDQSDERLKLLIKGQEWVVRKIDEALETRPPRSVLASLTEIRRVHDVNIGMCREYLESET